MDKVKSSKVVGERAKPAPEGLQKLATNSAPIAREGSGSTAFSLLAPFVRKKGTRGGSSYTRLKPQRLYREIPVATVKEVYAAIEHSAHIDLLPTHHITINWELGGVTSGAHATARFLKLLKDAARSRGWQTSHIWVQESGRRIGAHAHILVHLPPGIGNWLGRLKPSWLKACGAHKAKGLSKTTRITGRPLTATPFEPHSSYYLLNVQNVVQYTLKHCVPEAAALIGRRAGLPTRVTGKHVSISQNLHRKARSRCQQCRPVNDF